jgi:RimJ/RimL family protein N-acetyltransferase
MMDYNPRLETKRLVLRKITKTDKDDLFELLTNSKIDRRMVWNHLDTMEEITEYIDEIVSTYEKNEPSCFGIELQESGRLIGIIKFINYKEEFHALEVHYMLLPLHHNKGIMTEALIKVISFVFKKTSINRIEAYCLKSNPASGKVLEKAGLHLEGILREKIFINDEFVDLKMFSIIKSDIQYI